ncbi:flagellar basal body rod protein FlgB [Nocardioides sp. R-C-SC26]|uniref:flagellar basal body rod protein FlgB n=1 Tax=Nocardioides sp. R-C-SC26 TaxID=2870414 RepID=UPI001E2E06B2|nr:flagellar basal body rod protein FlgB [Nocardioides sp. R-C-SC26]
MSVPAYAAGDAVSSVLGFALDGLAMRQRTIADNLANVDTPDFRASSVDFESALQSAISRGNGEESRTIADIARSTPASIANDTPVGPDGNNVDLRKETLAAVQSQFQYQMVARAVTDRFELIKTAAGAF